MDKVVRRSMCVGRGGEENTGGGGWRGGGKGRCIILQRQQFMTV